MRRKRQQVAASFGPNSVVDAVKAMVGQFLLTGVVQHRFWAVPSMLQMNGHPIVIRMSVGGDTKMSDSKIITLD